MSIITQKSHVLSVSKLTHQIKRQLNSEFGSISVQGEISSIKKHTSGHVYFSIKDSFAQLNCVMFRSSIKDMHLPKEGDLVICHGEIDVYLPRGSYQLLVKKIEMTGLGELLIQLEQLKEELKSLGWFDKENKKPLPKFPKKMGIITSPTGAVIQDMIHVLKRRSRAFHLIIHPVHVQGEMAAKEITCAIQDFNFLQNVDVIIIARGGGSVEDLLSFNEKSVAKAIFDSQISIISAVGHETDYTICDLVADIRAPTPSAAAEIVMQESINLENFILEKQIQLKTLIHWNLQKQKARLHRFQSHPLFCTTHLLNSYFQRFDEMVQTTQSLISKYLNEKKQTLALKKVEVSSLNPSMKLYNLKKNHQKQQKHMLYLLKQKQQELIQAQKNMIQHKERLILAVLYYLKQKRLSLKKLISHLQSLDPKNLMKKGYAILKDANQKVISKLNEIEVNKTLFIHLQDGKLKTNVLEKIKEFP